MILKIPALTEGQAQSWRGLLAVAEIVPGGWCLVGGQMVHLHCWERGAFPNRPTDDVDTVLDIRAHPQMLRTFTEALSSVGFRSSGESWEGHQHRWVRDQAQIDVLIPSSLGERARRRTGVTGGTTLETPRAQGAIDRAEPITVDVEGVTGVVYRPSLLGALLMKSAAYSVTQDRYRERHLIDVAVLCAIVNAGDLRHASFTPREIRRISAALDALESQGGELASVDGVVEGVRRVRLVLDGR